MYYGSLKEFVNFTRPNFIVKENLRKTFIIY